MTIEKEQFGIRVKRLRESRNWKQEELAERMGISSNYLSSIERGKENPTFDMLIKLASSLEVEMRELFEFGHEVSPDQLKEIISGFAETSDPEKLKLAVKILRAILR